MQPTIQTDIPPKKRLALFLDGTWGTVGSNTNVWRLRSLCAEKGDDGTIQRRYYDVGLNGVRGGAWGEGLSDNVVQAYNWLVENYETGDDIFIFGYSRGAYTARSLAGFLGMCGLLKPGGALGANQLYDRYRSKGAQDRSIYALAGGSQSLTPEEHLILKYSRAVPIHMVGVWDTVGALGIPIGKFQGVSTSTLGFHHTGLRRPIKHGFHAVAIDEHRSKFAQTLWTVRGEPSKLRPQPRTIDSVEQRWFVGSHGSVGGGDYNDLLPQIPLRWMMRKASSCGLVFRNELEVGASDALGPISDPYTAFLWGLYSVFSPRHYRPIGGPPEVTPAGTHYTVNETIDGSVFDRWRADDNYRPRNLLEWAERLSVSPTNLSGAVRADQPNVAVPD
jgi:uncharacterized protein (DUF2235 family)